MPKEIRCPYCLGLCVEDNGWYVCSLCSYSWKIGDLTWLT